VADPKEVDAVKVKEFIPKKRGGNHKEKSSSLAIGIGLYFSF
jgi:hypothetical protein